MPINPLGNNNPNPNGFTASSSQENQATQESAAQARPEGASDGADATAPSSPSHRTMAGRAVHLQMSLVASMRGADTYRASLEQWKKDAPPNEQQARAELSKRIIEWKNANNADEPLDLSAESLSEEWGIEETITDLPPLPSGLQQVGMAGHRLKSLAADRLPDSLFTLDVSSNALTELPENLPDSLLILNVSFNALTELPENLPPALKVLYVQNNHLKSLPENLPPTLRDLFVEYNRLNSLPEHLPETLMELDAKGNYLERLPTRLPNSLTILNARQGRAELEVPTGVVEAASREEDPCEIDLRGTRLSVVSQERIAAHNERVAQSGVGMAILGDVNVYGVKRSSQTLGDAVRAWYGTRAPGYVAVWRNIRQEAISKVNAIPLEQLNQATEEELNEAHKSGRFTDPSVPFWVLLDSLNGTLDAKTDSTFRERVVALLNGMEDDKELRDTCFSIAYDAIETCHDNVTLGFNKMEQAHLARRAAKGDFTPQEIFNLGLGTFKLQMLDKLAKQKAREKNNEQEELEVVLFYRQSLAPLMQLPHQSRTMLFQAQAIRDEDWNLVKSDLVNAARAVQSAANDPQQLTEFLITWEPWQQDLVRRYPEKFSEAAVDAKKTELQEQLSELMESDDLNESDKMERIKTLQEKFNNVEGELFRAERERLTREFVMSNVASGS